MNLLRRIKLRHLECFVETARHMSVSRAAEALDLTQPAVSRTLRELEELCGTALLMRDGRGIMLSPEGEVFLRHATASLASARSGVAALAELGRGDGPLVRVGALPTVSATLLPRAVQTYQGSAVRNRLRILTGENTVLLEALRDGMLDMVMGRMPAPERMIGLSFEPLHREEVVFVTAADHPLARQGNVAVGNLDQYPVLVPPEGSIIRPIVERLFLELVMPMPERALETVSETFAKAYLRIEPAIWIISRGVVALELERGEFAALPIDTRSSVGPVGLIMREGIALSPGAGYFADVIRRTAGLMSGEQGPA